MCSEYSIGFKRHLAIKKGTQKKNETDSPKFVTLPLVRWARFLSKLDSIDEQLERLRSVQQVEFQIHIGEKLYASVSHRLKWPTGDLRGLYLQPENGIRPTNTGICLSYNQWQCLQNPISELHNDHESARTARCCQTQPDRAMMNFCGECNPFASDLGFISTT